MPWKDFETNIRNSSLDFSDEQIQVLKQNITDLYRIFKTVFDSPRKQYKPYSSALDYKIKHERIYDIPADFYNFVFDNINIHIHKRRNSIYSVAVCGIALREDFLNGFNSRDEYMDRTEKEYSCGFVYYGHYQRSDFFLCVNLFLKIVVQAICQKLDIKYQKIIEQLELIF